jgi:hypothetical protein
MSKYIGLLLLSGLLCCSACKKEAKPAATADTPDPYVRKDNPSSAADHAIFLFYQQTGIPVLYGDTVSTNPMTTLNIGYHLTTYDSLITVRYLHDSNAVLAGVNFIQNQIYPSLGGSLRPFTFLLTDSLYTFTPSYLGHKMINENFYQGLKTLAIGRVSQLDTMSADSLKTYKRDIFKSILLTPLSQQSALLADFYAVSAAYYGKYAYGDGTIPGYIAYAPKGTYGLLVDGTEYSNYYPTKDEATDLSNYLSQVLVLSADEFNAQYSAYPLVLKKYNLLIKALTTLQFKMPY